ncbi:Uncharacterized protein dnm_020180 [Desulfonema magnum]|uniref:Uncharacterized protein n=1 Tax=Desulfonema magnum TaxID=45655 RepID=A0A975BIN1_9BACT|nr:Uncharacterized protein dnm_020180 [Desulfonema magnum]
MPELKEDFFLIRGGFNFQFVVPPLGGVTPPKGGTTNRRCHTA